MFTVFMLSLSAIFAMVACGLWAVVDNIYHDPKKPDIGLAMGLAFGAIAISVVCGYFAGAH